MTSFGSDAFTKVSSLNILTKPVITQIYPESSKKLIICWNRVPGASGYNRYRYNSKSGRFEYVKSAAKTATAASDQVAAAGTRYYYQVRAYYNYGTETVQYSAYSASKSAIGIAKPENLTTTATSTGGIKLSWSNAAGSTGFQVYRYDSASQSWKRIRTTAMTSYTDTNVTSGRIYYYKVRAYHTVGGTRYYGLFGNSRTGMYLPQVSGLKVTAKSGGTASVSWNKASGAAGYNGYRYDPVTGSYQYLTSTTSTSYTDRSLVAGRKYSYRVRTYKKGTSVTYYGVYSNTATIYGK